MDNTSDTRKERREVEVTIVPFRLEIRPRSLASSHGETRVSGPARGRKRDHACIPTRAYHQVAVEVAECDHAAFVGKPASLGMQIAPGLLTPNDLEDGEVYPAGEVEVTVISTEGEPDLGGLRRIVVRGEREILTEP